MGIEKRHWAGSTDFAALQRNASGALSLGIPHLAAQSAALWAQ